MGCNSSSSKQDKPNLSLEQKRLIADSWKELHIDLERIGMLMFMGIFDTHPETRRFFQFAYSTEETDGDSKNRQRLREHGLRFMNLVKKLLAYVNDDERFDNLLIDLGRRHKDYSADIDMISIFEEQFIISIRPTLKHSWDPNVEEAWTRLFEYIAYMMKRGINDDKKTL
ncbi:neuroglobin-like [Glandiceps talaboti]